MDVSLELKSEASRAAMGDIENVLPGGERMQPDARSLHGRAGLREDVVLKQHEDVIHHQPRRASHLAEPQFRSAVGGQVLDQQNALAGFPDPFDMGLGAEPLRPSSRAVRSFRWWCSWCW